MLGGGDDLGRERLVDLDQVDVVDRHAGPRQRLAHGLDRTEPHDLGVEPGHTGRHDPRQRRDAQLTRLGVAHHHHGGGTVVERAGVAGGDRPVGTEHRLETGQTLGGGVGARPVVLRHDGAVGQHERRDLVLPETVLLVGHGELLAAGRELVHLLAGDALGLHDVLGGLTHSDVEVGQPLARGPHRSTTLRTLGGAGARLTEDRVGSGVGGTRAVAADGLDAGGDEAVALARLDGVRRHPDRLQAGRAVPVDGHARHVVEPCQYGGGAPDVETGFAGRLAAAHDQVFDVVGADLRHLRHQGLHDLSRHVVGTQVDERALPGPPDRAPSGGNDHSFSHVDQRSYRRVATGKRPGPTPSRRCCVT